MVVAIPVFGSRISPRFDCAITFLLVTIENGEIQKKETVMIYEQNPIHTKNNFKKLNVDLLVCAAINEFNYNMISDSGIKIIPWVTGTVDEIIELLLKNELKAGMTIFPDGRKTWKKCQGFGRKYRRKKSRNNKNNGR